MHNVWRKDESALKTKLPTLCNSSPILPSDGVCLRFFVSEKQKQTRHERVKVSLSASRGNFLSRMERREDVCLYHKVGRRERQTCFPPPSQRREATTEGWLISVSCSLVCVWLDLRLIAEEEELHNNVPNTAVTER